MDASGILSGLNSDQRAAVLHNHETGAQLLILAGAGSGKTSVLTKRIQYRIASGVKPEKILALTFTAKAAAEMRERVQKLFPDAGVRLCTFHSLALFMLKQKIGENFAYDLVGFKKVPVPQESANRDFLKLLSSMKIPAGTLNREELFSPDFSSSLEQKIRPLRECVLKSGQVVFEDLIYQAINLLEAHDDARRFFWEMWDEIMVDEYQDINPSQYRLVKALLGNRKSLFVVGDDDQAIYGFRGADIGNINRFCDDFKESTIIRLEWNYRSVPNVLHLANAIFKNKPLRLRKVLRAGNLNGSCGNPLFKENREPEVWVSENALEEMQKIIGKIRELRVGYDLSWKNFAILVRYNRQRLYYEEALRDAGIPVAGAELDENLILEDGVHVETVHASKGLQYAVVFYAGLAEGLTPGDCQGSRKQRKLQLEEERRLYYVGVTRAEACLFLLYCKERNWKGVCRKWKPSRFLPDYGKRFEKMHQGKWTMPLPLFKFYVIARVGLYMLWQIIKFPFILLIHGKNVSVWMDKKIQDFAAFCMDILRIDLDILDQANLAKVDWTRPVFVMGNHNSFADIPVTFLALERSVGFIAKKELGKIPFLNFWMKRIGCILVDRKKGGGGEMVRKAISCMDSPRIFIFPEGTRSRDGKLLPFKSGGFRLAQEAEAIVLPLAICGTGEVWERRLSSARCKVRVQVLEPIDFKALAQENGKCLDPKLELAPMVRDRIMGAL